jgi:hypothetical protein
MLIVSHVVVFVKIDVMGIIIAILGVGKAQTSMRQDETGQRNITIHLPGLAAPIMLNATAFGQVVLFHALLM